VQVVVRFPLPVCPTGNREVISFIPLFPFKTSGEEIGDWNGIGCHQRARRGCRGVVWSRFTVRHGFSEAEETAGQDGATPCRTARRGEEPNQGLAAERRRRRGGSGGRAHRSGIGSKVVAAAEVSNSIASNTRCCCM
jgi:hypothetical protein